MAGRMIVDVQNHLVPMALMGDFLQAGLIDLSVMPPMFRWRGVSMSSPRDFVDLELHLQTCREAGITHVLLHQGMFLTPCLEVLNMTTAEAARRHNEAMAEITAPYRDIIFPYGYINPHDGRQAVREAERCLDEFGFVGIGVDTSYGTDGRQFLHTPDTFEFWEFAAARRAPVFIHPAMLAYGWEWGDRYKLDETVIRPNETGLSVSLMLLSGLFDRFPGLRVIMAHMGGSFTMCLPRLQFAHRMGSEGFLEYQKPRNREEPVFYARKNIYVDTMGFHPPGIRHAIEVYGLDHVLLGTDYGPVPFHPREHIEIVTDRLGLTVEEQDRILGLNARDLFSLPEPD